MSRDQLRRMVDISRILNATTDIDRLLYLIIKEAAAMTGAVFQSNRPAIIADVSREPRRNKKIDKAIDFHTCSILAVPMHDVERLRRLIQDMLNLRYTDSELPLQLNMADLTDLVHRLILEKEEAVRSRQHKVTLRPADNPVWG